MFLYDQDGKKQSKPEKSHIESADTLVARADLMRILSAQYQDAQDRMKAIDAQVRLLQVLSDDSVRVKKSVFAQ